MEHLELSLRQSHVVVLKGLGAAGYRWTVFVDNPSVLRVVRTVAGFPAGTRAAGSSSCDEQFRVTGLAIGRTVVHFRQTRSFEPHSPPRATHEIKVIVT